MAPKVEKRKELSSDSSDSDDEPSVEMTPIVTPKIPIAETTVKETPKMVVATTPKEMTPHPNGKQHQHKQPMNKFPRRHFTTPTDNSQSRSEIQKAVTNMYGSGCKGKKFRKEKGKKKRSQYSGARIDGSVRSVRLDS